MFRHAIVLSGGAELNGPQCQTVLTSAVRACERYYQAFQFVVWAGKTSREAIETVMLETKGEASKVSAPETARFPASLVLAGNGPEKWAERCCGRGSIKGSIRAALMCSSPIPIKRYWLLRAKGAWR